MQRWSYGTNNLYKTAHIHLEEAPWWVWVLTDAPNWVCDLVPRWRVPLIGRIRIVRDGEETTIKEWYGDDLHSWFCGFVDMPLTNWAWNRVKCVPVEVTWEYCKKLFYEKDPAYWDEMEADPEFGKFTRPDELDEHDRRIFDRVMEERAQEG